MAVTKFSGLTELWVKATGCIRTNEMRLAVVDVQAQTKSFGFEKTSYFDKHFLAFAWRACGISLSTRDISMLVFLTCLSCCHLHMLSPAQVFVYRCTFTRRALSGTDSHLPSSQEHLLGRVNSCTSCFPP